MQTRPFCKSDRWLHGNERFNTEMEGCYNYAEYEVWIPGLSLGLDPVCDSCMHLIDKKWAAAFVDIATFTEGDWFYIYPLSDEDCEDGSLGSAFLWDKTIITRINKG